MHRVTEEIEQLAARVLGATLERRRASPLPLGSMKTADELAHLAGETITPDGIGAERALRLWIETLAPATIAVDHPRYLSFIPQAPTEASVLFDLLLSAASVYAGSWFEASGAVYAENQALRWLADLAGLPSTAGGTFVPGGTLGNLAALHTGRHAVGSRRRGGRPARWSIVASADAHSSVAAAARVMDVDVIPASVDDGGRLTADSVRAAIAASDNNGLFAVVATAGTTNLGIIDDLAGIAAICRERGLWFHVDGSYGAAALAVASMRARFTGIERADSLIIDPHKWLFAPYDCCAVLYRDPGAARAAHSQSADYLDVINQRNEWNPADYAVQLSRRARGLPFWFSLAVHGSRAYADAIATTLEVTQKATAAIRSRPHLELLMEPDLTVLVFRRRGWSANDYHAWSQRLLAEGIAFVMPTQARGEPAARICIVNPRTTVADIELVLNTMG